MSRGPLGTGYLLRSLAEATLQFLALKVFAINLLWCNKHLYIADFRENTRRQQVGGVDFSPAEKASLIPKASQQLLTAVLRLQGPCQSDLSPRTRHCIHATLQFTLFYLQWTLPSTGHMPQEARGCLTPQTMLNPFSHSCITVFCTHIPGRVYKLGTVRD